MSKEIQWCLKKYGVGHKDLDSQHQTIIRLINQLSVDNEYSYSSSLYDFTLEELIHYADWHLSFEENLMKEICYPEFDSHKEEHQTFIDKVEVFKSHLVANTPKLRDEVISFLTDWLNDHIIREDKKLTPYIRQHQASS